MSGLMSVANIGTNDKACDLLSVNVDLAENGESDKVREDAIYNVAEILRTRGYYCRLSDGDVKKIADMLDSEQGSMINWAAICLGYVGERARGTAPKMLTLLAKNECETIRGLSFTGALRFALKRFGVSPPEAKCS